MAEPTPGPEPLRVAVLLPSLQVGGAERLVLEELAYLKDDPQLTFELHLVFEGGPFFDAFAALGIPAYVWGAPHKSVRMLGNYANIIRHLRRNRCQVLHSHLLDGIGPLVGRLAGARVVSTVHSDTRYSLLERLVLGRSDRVLGCGRKVVETVGRFIPPARVSALPNAVAPPPKGLGTARRNIRARFGVSEDARLLVSLGRLAPAKGFDVLLEAFCLLASEVPDSTLLIGGDGPEMTHLRQMATAAGLGERIRLPGHVVDTRELLAAADLYVNSSRVEGLPMTLLEAMAQGLPMVATRVGGNPEVVRDGSTGLLVPPDDPVHLAGAIKRMLQDEPLRCSAGTAAQALFLRDYTIAGHCETLKRHYLGLVAERAA